MPPSLVMRALVATLLLLASLPAGCLSDPAPGEVWAREHLDLVETLEIRVGNTTHTLDRRAEAERELTLSTLEALYGIEPPTEDIAYPHPRSGNLPRSLERSEWVRVSFDGPEMIEVPGANGSVITEDTWAIWHAPHLPELEGSLLLGNSTMAYMWDTGSDVAHLRDLSVELLHRRGLAGT